MSATVQVTPASPAAVRWRSPGWRDPRLLLGVTLLATSVALGSWLVSSAGRTEPVYAARVPLVAGDVLDAESLVVREVRLDGGPDVYLSAAVDLPAGLVVVRTVGQGELVPFAATAESSALDLRPVAITPSGPMSRAVVAGASVDLWFVPADDGAAGSTMATTAQTSGAPRQLAAGLAVSEVSEETGTFAVGAGRSVQVLVPVADLPDVLAALAADGTVEVVPVPGGTP